MIKNKTNNSKEQEQGWKLPQVSITSDSPDTPDTRCIRDIETRVFQSIVLKCLDKIKGISLLEGSIIDHILGRDEGESVRGIHVEQDHKKQMVNIRVEVNIQYGISIPEKANEIQEKVMNDLVKMTGLHVASIHIVFKNLILEESEKKQMERKISQSVINKSIPSHSSLVFDNDIDEKE